MKFQTEIRTNGNICTRFWNNRENNSRNSFFIPFLNYFSINMNFSPLRNLNSYIRFKFRFLEHFLKIPYLYLLCSPLESFLIKFQRIFHVFFTFEVYIYIYLQPLSSCFESIKTIAHFACVLLDSLIKWYVSCVYIGARDPSLPLPLISLAFRSSPSQTVA